MEDKEIIALYLNRDENALHQTKIKYGERCYALAFRILNSKEDAEEAVNDTYMKAWKTVPLEHPDKLFPYLAMLCRQISIDLIRKKSSLKRGSGEYELSLDELNECIPDSLKQSDIDVFVLRDSLNSFLSKLPKKKRVIFMRRYWWCNSISEIASDYSMSESSVKMTLLRIREKLKAHLEKEGFEI